MRSVRVRHVHHIDTQLAVEVETEELLDNDEDAEQAGRNANIVLRAVLQGIIQEADEN